MDGTWLHEATALDLCGIKRPTWIAWSEQGFVARPDNGAYGLEDVVGVALVSQLRRALPVEDMTAAWRAIVKSGIADEVAKRAPTLREEDRLDLVIEPASGRVALATDDIELAQAVRHPSAPRAVIVISPGSELCRVVDGFTNRALSTEPPTQRRRGRPRGQSPSSTGAG
jgi:hypothetical protein